MKITDIKLNSSYMADRLAEGIKIQHTTGQNLDAYKNYKFAKAGSTDKSNFFFYRNTIHDADFISVNSPVGGIGDYIRFNSKYVVEIKNIRIKRVNTWVGADYEWLRYRLGEQGFEGYSYKHNCYLPRMKVAETLISCLYQQNENVDSNSWVWVIDFDHCDRVDVWMTFVEKNLLAESLKAYFNELDIAVVNNIEYAEKFTQWGEPAEAKDCDRVIKVMQDKRVKLKALFEKLMGYPMHSPVTDCNDFDEMPF